MIFGYGSKYDRENIKNNKLISEGASSKTLHYDFYGNKTNKNEQFKMSKIYKTRSKTYKSSRRKSESQCSSEILISPRIIDIEGKDVTPRRLQTSSDTKYLMKTIGSNITRIDSVTSDSLHADLGILREVDFEVVEEEIDKIPCKTKTTIPSVLENPGYIILRETETICILDISDILVKESNEEYESVQKRNLEYKDCVELNKSLERMHHVETQTFLPSTKTKVQQTEILSFKDAETSVSEALIYDETTYVEPEDKKIGIDTITLKSDTDERLVKQITLPKENFIKSLNFMERAINSVIYRDSIDYFKQITSSELSSDSRDIRQSNENKHEGIKFEKLLVMNFQYIEDYIVTSLSWNEKNIDILVVGYSHKKYPITKKGYICCWCIKNCEIPERIYEAPYGVKCVKFCNVTPYLLAAGMYEGGVAIYDARSTKPYAILDNLESNARPMGIIWDLYWRQWSYKEKVNKRKYAIISVSGDGSVQQWTIENKLKCTTLMHLTRISNISEGKDISNFITQNVSGYSIEFSKHDPDIYIVSSDQGDIYQCSFLYNEHHLSLYTFHRGPTYYIEWSPFNDDTFLSCGNDSTVAIWSENNNNKPFRVIKIGKELKAVIDASWSHTSSTIFAACTEDNIEIWDLAISLKEPITSIKPSYGSQFTCINYCPKGDILAAGFNNIVTLYANKTSHNSKNK